MKMALRLKRLESKAIDPSQSLLKTAGTKRVRKQGKAQVSPLVGNRAVTL